MKKFEIAYVSIVEQYDCGEQNISFETMQDLSTRNIRNDIGIKETKDSRYA